ncbi:MAG TPA: glycoside hydrolase family 38 C-terminal domain-containing protein [Candidatus Sumerlaeia bacterium]|nr:glycoside hydrolase family 38 C-terminal domain-containing protein [Candidatus Sumerlaeia bacterium]
MLIDSKLLPKLAKIEEYYMEMRFKKVAEISPMQMYETREHLRREPDKNTNVKWRNVNRGQRWGGSGVTAWFRGDFRLPMDCEGKKVFLNARTGGESLLLMNGEPQGVFDRFHPIVLLTMKGRTGDRYHIALESYSGSTFPGTQPHEKDIVVAPKSLVFDGADILLQREDVCDFVYNLRVLRQLINALDEHSLRRNQIIKALNKVFAVIDFIPMDQPEKVWRPKLAQARKIMQPLMENKNAPTTPTFGVVNHSHIDTAWLWTLAETRRKCARTFSSMLNLMEQYPEAVFIQSAPCHAEMIREDYPEIFERMKKIARARRWEPNGGMWVEAEVNIASGESLVRNFLFGQQATREMFDYTSDTLWLPDVFGFPASLPQIMRGCGVEYFCTTKLDWNDSTRFPYDTFHWKGIDGTTVLVHFNTIACWADPESLHEFWKRVQHKEIQDRRLCAIGHGDGGGGPMMEMLEVARRIEDLEGCPRIRHTTVSKFMKGVRDELQELPTWSGEMYLENHRGTLTSIADIKRLNRKAEIALRNAEFINVLAASGKGFSYPKEDLRKIWKNLLILQFHDILPGSSIKQVNIEAIDSYQKILREAQALERRALENISHKEKKSNGMNILLFNSLSWERSGEINLEKIPAGFIPSDENIQSQTIINPAGERRLILGGVSIPALGGTIIPFKKGKKTGRTPFKVSENKIETPYAIVTLDKNGAIVSLLDKRAKREIVKYGGVLNRFMLGADIPDAWDNWNTDAGQKVKTSPGAKLIKRKVAAVGNLQLRLRTEYQIGTASKLVQDIVFHALSEQIDFESVLDWKERRALLKTAFDFDILCDFARHEIQFGHLERPMHWNQADDRAQFEVCAHKWTDISDNGFGVALLNDCKYGVCAKDGDFTLTLIKAGVHPDERADAGRHYFTYSILPHAQPFSVDAVARPAYELNTPIITLQSDATVACPPSLFTIDAPNVIVESIKWAEGKKGYTVRLYEAGKMGTHVSIKFSSIPRRVWQTNMLEENPIPLDRANSAINIYIRPFEIKTLVCEI